jgi:glycosyltransferase involved in cell wall biosynthesis
VVGRTLVVDEELTFEKAPDAVALQVTEAVDRPLRFDVEADLSHAVDVVDTAGLKEYRSFWGELPRVHQVDLQPAPSMRFRWSVTPKVRVASSGYGHHYDDGLYRHLTADVDRARLRTERLRDPEALARSLQAVDVLHLHWPEWTTGIDVECARVFVDVLRACDVRILWTMHNLAPHGAPTDESATALYQLWAGAADAVLHHSEWGRAVALKRYRYRPDALHRVVPHLHWGELMDAPKQPERAEAEQALGLEPCALRIGLVGAPRGEKDTQLVLDAFAATTRDDVQLLVCSLDDERVPDDPRIKAMPYEMVPRRVYDERLRCIDVFVLPFSSSGMLTTGTVGDVVATGAPALVSGWPYLHEALGDAGIPYGAGAGDLTERIQTLDAETVARAAAACRALRAVYAPARIAGRLLEVLEELGTAKL